MINYIVFNFIHIWPIVLGQNIAECFRVKSHVQEPNIKSPGNRAQTSDDGEAHSSTRWSKISYRDLIGFRSVYWEGLYWFIGTSITSSTPVVFGVQNVSNTSHFVLPNQIIAETSQDGNYCLLPPHVVHKPIRMVPFNSRVKSGWIQMSLWNSVRVTEK